MEQSDPYDVIIARAERAMAETRVLVARCRRLQQALARQSRAAEVPGVARGDALPPRERRDPGFNP